MEACTQGASSSIGVATIAQRGKVVVISQVIGPTVIGDSGHVSTLHAVGRYARGALTLMQETGVMG